MMSGSKDHRQHDKLDEIKNSTDEGIQSDINAPELMNKFELSCKHCNDRNNACQHLKEGIKTVGGNSEEETQGHAPGSKSLNFHILECQNLIQFESNLPNQSSNHVLPESITKLNQEQHVWQSQESVNELSMPFNTSSYLACSLEQQNSNRDGVVKQDIALFQEQIEKEQGDKRNNADSSKGLDRKKVGFKKLNDQIVQVDGLLYCSENVQNQEVQDGEMHRDTSTGLILHTNNEQNGLIIGFKSKNEHHRTAHTKASSTDTEDDDPKSQCHQQLTKETAQKYNHIDNHLDLSDDADYASDLPSGLEDLEVQTFQCSAHSKSSLEKYNVLSSTTSSSGENEIRGRKPNAPLRRCLFPHNRSTKEKSKVRRRKSKFSKSNAGSLVDNQPNDSKQSNLEQPSAIDLEGRLLPSPNSKPKVIMQCDLLEPKAINEKVQDGVQSKLLQDKLQQLEAEIDRFRAENNTLVKMKEEQELAMENLRKRMDLFEHKKTEEMARLEEYKKEEMKKLQKERRLSEKTTMAAKAMLDRREREEMELLKQQLGQLQEELRKNESGWATSHNHLQNQIQLLTKENNDLRGEVKAIEHQRQEAVRKAETAALISRIAETPAGGKAEVKLEAQKKEMREIQERVSVRLQTRSATPTERRRLFQNRSTPDLEMSIQRANSARQRGHDRKSPVPSLNLSVFPETNSTLHARGPQSSSNSGSSEDVLHMPAHSIEQMVEDVPSARTPRAAAKLPVTETSRTRSTAETVSRCREKPPIGRRSHSATPVGRRTPVDRKQLTFDLEQKSMRPHSALSRRESISSKSIITNEDVQE
uniref:Centromere protein J-like n=1 Tax=Callorhinchus milii TaxID=7868 RepID=A0A4W3HXN4_CALMI